MATKAELEAENEALRAKVAELEKDKEVTDLALPYWQKRAFKAESKVEKRDEDDLFGFKPRIKVTVFGDPSMFEQDNRDPVIVFEAEDVTIRHLRHDAKPQMETTKISVDDMRDTLASEDVSDPVKLTRAHADAIVEILGADHELSQAIGRAGPGCGAWVGPIVNIVG